MKRYTLQTGLTFVADDIVNLDDKDIWEKVFLVCEAVGYEYITRCITFADNAQDALEDAADFDKLRPIQEEDLADYDIDTDNPTCCFLGNDGRPFDLDYVACRELTGKDLEEVEKACQELKNRKVWNLDRGFGRIYKTAEVVEKPIYLPNASKCGYSEWMAEPGDFLTLGAGHRENIARMLGVVTSEEKPIILALVMAENGRHCYERWIDPDTVEQCHKSSPAELWSFFTGDLPDVQTTIDLASHGTLSASYAGEIEERMLELSDRRKMDNKH